MNRRSFITRTAAGLLGVSLVDVEWLAHPISRPLVANLSSIEGVTAAVLAEFCQGFSGRARSTTAGQMGDDGLSKQYGVEAMAARGDQALTLERQIRPAALSLVARAKDFRTFGCLQTQGLACDAAIAKDNASGVCVRGVRMYANEWYPRTEGWMYRFDVVGGYA